MRKRAEGEEGILINMKETWKRIVARGKEEIKPR